MVPVVVATATKADLLAELTRHTGEFVVLGEVSQPDLAGLDARQFDLLVGERDGNAYLVDPSAVLAHDPDLLISLSAELGTVLGGCASDSCWLVAARGGKPLRYVYWSAGRMTRGISMGRPLPSEPEHPIVDPDGRGVLAAMASFGLDPSDWLASGPATVVRYDFSRPALDGPVAKVRRLHVERYHVPFVEPLDER
jgi:hypothetical protein